MPCRIDRGLFALFYTLVLATQAVAFSGSGIFLKVFSRASRREHALGMRDHAYRPAIPLSICGTRRGKPIKAAVASEAPPALNIVGVHGGIDPALTRLLLQAARENVNFDLAAVSEASAGLQVWSTCLLKGRLPVSEDFCTARCVQWPSEPLFSRFSAVFADLQLPRFVLRHPDTIFSVLLSMLQLTVEFMEESQAGDEKLEGDEPPPEARADGEYTESKKHEHDDGPRQDLEVLADDLAGDMLAQLGGVIGGVQTLDQLFGVQHGLLDVAGQGGGGGGYGLHDGIWQHSGWRAIPHLQRRLAMMPELQRLMTQLGRRPTAQGDSMHKFSPQILAPDSTLSVQIDPAARASVNGLTLSSSLTEMVPSEAMLLRSSSPTLRRLFLAKKVEAKLLSYELSGWTETPANPRPRPRYLQRLPSAPGGPLILCLDTSWSMTGAREQLAKAVVLACVVAAHKQKRACQVFPYTLCTKYPYPTLCTIPYTLYPIIRAIRRMSLLGALQCDDAAVRARMLCACACVSWRV
jgi:hypothetical protein